MQRKILLILGIILLVVIIPKAITFSDTSISKTIESLPEESFMTHIATSEHGNSSSSASSSDKEAYTKPDKGFFASGRAISLNELQKRAEECVMNGTYPKDIFQLCGIKKISGYIVDKENRDIILIGTVDESSPPLYLEDFVIALRNEWLKYAPLKDNTYYYSPPGCSIDPDPAVFNNLQQISNTFYSDTNAENAPKYLNQWKDVCSRPQQVRIMGVPADTRFAKVMVEADYYAKRLVDGSVSLDIPGFTSLMDRVLNIARRDIQEGKPISVPLSFYNRFWFSPSENSFLESDGAVYIEKSDIILLTEEEYLTEKGEAVGTGRPNLLADEFAKNFSDQYAEIAGINPIYFELEALFRFVSLVKVMKFRDAPSEAQINLDYLLNRYPIRNISVNKTLSGISNVKEFKYEEEFTGGFSTYYLWLPSCGGVSIDIIIKEKNIAKDPDGILATEKERIIETRPSSDSLYWDFTDSGRISSTVSQRLHECEKKYGKLRMSKFHQI